MFKFHGGALGDAANDLRIAQEPYISDYDLLTEKTIPHLVYFSEPCDLQAE
jgi:hypothetical protein